MVTGRLNAMAARITDLKVAAAGAASSVEAAKRLAAAESEARPTPPDAGPGGAEGRDGRFSAGRGGAADTARTSRAA
ncbi:MAG: hypothetical protein ACLRZH_01330 [Ruthenibacterium lactatiformans]